MIINAKCKMLEAECKMRITEAYQIIRENVHSHMTSSNSYFEVSF